MSEQQATNTTTSIHDIVIIGAGPCSLAIAARLREPTPSALFLDFEHQRYHWLRRHAHQQPQVRTSGRATKTVLIPSASSSLNTTNNSINASSLLSKIKDKPRNHEHNHVPNYTIKVFDSTGNTWMERWKKLFKVFEIETLRSPLFFHPGPEDRDGLKSFAFRKGREREMKEIRGVCGKEISKHEKKKALKRNVKKDAPRGKSIDERDKQDYYTPSTSLFNDYCTDCITRYSLENLISQADVHSIRYHTSLATSTSNSFIPSNHFTITTSTGIHHARAVVLAIGPGTPATLAIPTTEAEGSSHSSTLMHNVPLPPHIEAKISSNNPTNIIVVGGGLTSAQICTMLLRKGITKVFHLIRSHYKLKHFDLSLPWVSKYKNLQLAEFFGLETDEERAEKLLIARNGGSITPAYDKILSRYIASGRLERHTHTTISTKSYNPVSKTWKITTNSPSINNLEEIEIDYIYYATGSKADISTVPVIQEMLTDYPIPIVGGLPCLTDELQWKENIPLFVAGRFAGLRLGPGASNLEGARMGAERIVCRLLEVLDELKAGEDGAGDGEAGSCDGDDGDSGVDVGEVVDGRERLEEDRRRFLLGSTHWNLYSALSDGGDE